VTGQDGSYLAEQLGQIGRRCTGLIHPHEALPGYTAAGAERHALTLVPCDLGDPAEFRQVLRKLQPDVVFHLAALSQPAQCEREPRLARQVNVISCEVLVEWQRRDSPGARVLLCSSATIFGTSPQPLSESSLVAPRGEYARQKLEVRELATQARGDGQFVACAIPFNHESERRPEDFVFAKVCNSVARIALGQQQFLNLGDLSACRDWGYAPEYVEAMRWMLDVDQPCELILGTGRCHSVNELADVACAEAEIPRETVTGRVGSGDADPRQAAQELGWEAQVPFHVLVKQLTRAALARLRQS
jgi:GDPmannose 4,6-dehydratase